MTVVISIFMLKIAGQLLITSCSFWSFGIAQLLKALGWEFYDLRGYYYINLSTDRYLTGILSCFSAMSLGGQNVSRAAQATAAQRHGPHGPGPARARCSPPISARLAAPLINPALGPSRVPPDLI